MLLIGQAGPFAANRQMSGKSFNSRKASIFNEAGIDLFYRCLPRLGMPRIKGCAGLSYEVLAHGVSVEM
jgi:hypothetical protein